MCTGAVDLMDGDRKDATVVQSGNPLTYMFTDYVAAHNSVTASLYFWAKFEESIVSSGETADVNLIINGKLIPTGTQIEARPDGPVVVNPYKWMAQPDSSKPVAG